MGDCIPACPFLLLPQPGPLAPQLPLCTVLRGRSSCSSPVSLLCHFPGFYPCIQWPSSPSCPNFEPGFFGAIFPPSPLGCVHPGIRGHEPPHLGHSRSSGLSVDHRLGARHQEGSPASLQVTREGPWPRTKSQPGEPGVPYRVGGTVLPEHPLCVKGLSLLDHLGPIPI